MQLKTYVMNGALAAAVVGAAGVAAQVPQARPEVTATVIGTVVDAETNQPIADAIVTFGNRAVTSAAVRLMTTAEGKFVVRDVPAGTVTVSVRASGYVNGSSGQTRPEGPSEPLRITDGTLVVQPRIVMWRTSTIAGTVLDDRGEPLTGFQVRALRRTFQRGQPQLVSRQTAVTDDRGQFRMVGLIPGDYVLHAPQTMASSPSRLMNRAIDAAMSGDMFGASGDFLEMAMSGGAMAVQGMTIGDLTVGSMQGQVPIASDGGTWRVYAPRFAPTADTSADAIVMALRAGETREGVTVTLPLVPTVSVSGQVLGPAGPLANVGVRVRPVAEILSGDQMSDIAAATTRADGTFEMPVVPRGNYVLRVLRPGRQTMPPAQMAQLEQMPPEMRQTMSRMFASSPEEARALFAEVPLVLEKSVAGLVVTTGSGATVAGRVAFVGDAPTAPAARTASMQITPLQTNWTTAGLPSIGGGAVRVQEDGTFTTVGYPPGRYALTVTNPPQGWRLQSVEVNGVDVTYGAFVIESRDIAGVTVRFTNRVSTITGLVTRTSNTAVSDVSVVVFPSGWRQWIENGMSPALQRVVRAAAADGKFSVEGMPPGEYLIVAVPLSSAPDLTNPATIDQLSRIATTLTLLEGETRTVSLRVQ